MCLSSAVVRQALAVPVTAWLESLTRLELRNMVTRLESRFSQNDSTRVTVNDSRLETRVRVIFTISLSSWWTNPVRLHTKKWAFYASVMIKIGANFLFCLSSCAMLHFKDQVSPPCVEVDRRLCFHQGRSQDVSKGGLKLWKQKPWKGRIACD